MEWAEQLLQGDRRALARGISLAEAGGPAARALLAALYPYTGKAHSIGVTGPPGAGKSTLVTALAQEWRRQGVSVGIIAVDPSSPFTGGALLGDRIRMQVLGGDPGVFIRSMASRGRLGGLARATGDAVALLDAAGYQVVLVETVGAGQGEVDIARTAQSTIVVEVPGMGDDVQAIKAGMLEIADIFVVNKADREGAELLVQQLRAMQRLGSAPATGWLAPVLSAVASSGQGIPGIIAALAEHGAHLRTSDSLRLQSHSRALRELSAAVGEIALEQIRAANPAAWDAAVASVADRSSDPYSAALGLLGHKL